MKSRRPKTRSSVRYCEEKYSCPLLNSPAYYFCKDCNSAQCQDCERDIHRRKLEFDFHIREKLPEHPESLLCQSRKFNIVCLERNFQDLWCNNCRTYFCFTCYDKYHSTEKKRLHISVSQAHHKKKLKEKEDEEVTLPSLTNDHYEDAQTDNMIKPYAPFSLADDSLTYFSYPQAPEDANNSMAFTSASNSFHSDQSGSSIPDVCMQVDFSALRQDGDCDPPAPAGGFILVDEQEILQVKNADDFVEKLGCSKDETFKVVSIFGNTGDGKSHTLNHVFFGGSDVFLTSTNQSSCTMGVWCALNKQYKTIVMDTEGLLGSSSNENQRTRLLLKILAVSDIVIYRTRAERLHNDMYAFLSSASKAYCKHFTKELEHASKKYGIPESSLGPTLVVFQETTHTEVLKGTHEPVKKSASGVLREMFVKSGNPIDAFRNVCYIGVKTVKQPTKFELLQQCLTRELHDNSIRVPRKVEIIFNCLKALNDKFSDKIEAPQLNTFPDQYFTCTSKCLACSARCTLSMNHDTNCEPHDAGADSLCKYQNQLGNKVFMCKTCLKNKQRIIVVPKTSSASDNSFMGFTKYIWSGYVYECSNCGIIYRSREHWYGNEDEEKMLHVEFRHVWPQGPAVLDGTHNAARKVLEGFELVADAISSVSLKPTKILSEWTADQINPSYWVPNSEIIKCNSCEELFTCNEQKHHCRACGKGFCMECSSKQKPVPERGWDQPVRVCDKCYSDEEVDIVKEPVTARKVGEAVTSAVGAMTSVFNYPLGMMKNSARPSYWIPDDEISSCCVCDNKFGPRLYIHHCRACGKGVCEECSPSKRTVPFRGWDYPVRVCKKCEMKTDNI